MSTPTHARHAAPARPRVLPRPRRPSDPPLDVTAPRRSGNRQTSTSEPVSVFGRHPWLVPATGIACVIAVFVAMVLLTWAAGGATPFDR